ncbi:hypothetical protein [uncultured Desulfobacter sp.]|nr:hypothetical protein [uncultured Desulfobacter sp.]
MPVKTAEGRATTLDRMGEVSRRHSSRWKRALQKWRGLTPVKA